MLKLIFRTFFSNSHFFFFFLKMKIFYKIKHEQISVHNFIRIIYLKIESCDIRIKKKKKRNLHKFLNYTIFKKYIY